jgi:hypothetical protein
MIDDWLQEFMHHWMERDVDSVMKLFTPTINYWETPFKKFDSLGAVKKEWQYIKNQRDIDIQAKRVVSENNVHTVQWELNYNLGGRLHRWDGLYIIQLQDDGRCSYFYQVGEEKKMRQFK